VKPEIVIGYNSFVTSEQCAICWEHIEPDIGPAPFVKGTGQIVCYDCLDEVTRKKLVRAKDKFSLTFPWENTWEDFPHLKPSKETLLRHYANPHKKVQRFFQLDCFIDQPEYDDVMKPDEDGDCLMGGVTNELRTCGEELAVRIQIHEKTDPKTAIRLLKKALSWLETDEIFFNPDNKAEATKDNRVIDLSTASRKRK